MKNIKSRIISSDVNSRCCDIKKYHADNMVQIVNNTRPPQPSDYKEIVPWCFSQFKPKKGYVNVHFPDVDYHEGWAEALC